MDPARYIEPCKFNPDRYQHDFKNAYDSAVGPEVAERDHLTFGAGRRIVRVCTLLSAVSSWVFLSSFGVLTSSQR